MPQIVVIEELDDGFQVTAVDASTIRKGSLDLPGIIKQLEATTTRHAAETPEELARIVARVTAG